MAILAISGSSWVYLAPFQAYDFGRRTMHSRFSKICTSPTREHHFWVTLRPSCGHFWGILGHLGAILGPCWPSRGHLGSILRHFSVTISEDRRCIANFAKCAQRPHESTIVRFLRVRLAPFWGHLGAILGYLGVIIFKERRAH